MPYEQLVVQGRIKSYKARPQEIRNLLQVAARDLAAAERNLGDPDWAYTIAYNAILQITNPQKPITFDGASRVVVVPSPT